MRVILPLTVFLAGSGLAAEMRFRPVSIADEPTRIGGEAYRMLAPEGWRVEGGIVWSTALANPAAPWVRWSGPSGREIGVFPPAVFVWNDQLIGPFFPPGTLYAGTEVGPPVLDPIQCIEHVIVPRYRRSLASAGVVQQELLPDLADATRPDWQLPKTRVAAGRVRFAYTERGAAMEEDVYTVVVSIQYNVGPTVSTIWLPTLVRYSKAPRGTLDQQTGLFETLLYSLHPDLKWWSKLQRVQRSMVIEQQMQKNTAVDWWWQQTSAFQREDAALAANAHSGAAVDPILFQRYQDNLASLDRINSRWGGRVDVYRDPANGRPLELPAAYGSAWTNGRGEYLVTDSAPSPGGGWHRLERAR